MTRPTTMQRRRAFSAGMAMALYLAAAVAVPILHAETEVIRGSTGVERGHSEACTTIHSPATCLTVVTFQLPAAAVRHTTAAAAPRAAGIRLAPPGRPIKPAAISSLRVRAPPTV